MTQEHDVAGIARGLTKAQREELLDMQSGPLIITRTLVCWALKRKGLCAGEAAGPWYCSGEFRLTPLGLAVQKHLKEQSAS